MRGNIYKVDVLVHNYVFDVMFHEKIQLTNIGTVKLPQGPGLGVELNWEALREYKVE